MNTIFQKLLIVSALSVATFAASAQPTSTTPPSTTVKPDQTQAAPPPATTRPNQAQIDRDFDKAKAACEMERSQTARGECLRRADDNYRKSTGFLGAPVGPGNNTSGSSMPSARQRS